MYYLVFLATFFMLFAPPAEAYIDACTGSYLVQMIIGAVLTVILPLQRCLRRISVRGRRSGDS